MTLEDYYGDFLESLEKGKDYLEQLAGQYPVRETEDGIHPMGKQPLRGFHREKN